MGEDRENGVLGQDRRGTEGGRGKDGHESSKRGGSGRNYSIIAIKTGLKGKPRKKGRSC